MSSAALVIFGASGDLTSRKLMPALAELFHRGLLGADLKIVGVARTAMADGEFQRRMTATVDPKDRPTWAATAARFHYLSGDYADPQLFKRLADLLGQTPDAAPVFYFAAPPTTFELLVGGLASAGLNALPGRVVIEKPFGRDGASAADLDRAVHAAFTESQVYRIDHYLGKETVQNLLALRFANAIFEPLWNRTYIDHLEVTVAESIGVEHRGGFYEQAGALRDIVQNHVTQVLALTLMEPPVSMDANGIRDEKVKALRAVVGFDSPVAGPLEERVVRAQYDAGLVGEEKVAGYRSEESVWPESKTETYVALRFAVDNWRWAGVPIYVRTGKRLAKRVTEIALHFRRAPHLPFAVRLAKRLEPNSLIVRIQPTPGISLRFGAKVPGQSFTVRTATMDFDYESQFTEEDLDGYERLLLDALMGDQTLFIRSDEVHEAWRIADPILEAFVDPDMPLGRYAAGTWGPAEADRLLDRQGHRWRTP